MIVPKDKIIKLLITIGSTVALAIATKIIEEHEHREHTKA